MEVLYGNADWLAEPGYDESPTSPEMSKEIACQVAANPFSETTDVASPPGFHVVLHGLKVSTKLVFPSHFTRRQTRVW